MIDPIRLALHELIAALDRRRPRVGHPAEPGISQDAAALRTRACEQIVALDHGALPDERSGPGEI